MTAPRLRALRPAPRSSAPKTVRDAWLGAAFFAAVAVTVRLVDPTRPGRFPSCPFHSLTGLDCPGCGSLRALHQLTLAHVPAAADYNLLLVLFLPCAAVVWLRAVTGGSGRRGVPRWGPRLALIVVVLWTVLRNLPVFGGVLAA
nr:DUF2752 domain-containing protein [Streptomyces sp. NBC_00974]